MIYCALGLEMVFTVLPRCVLARLATTQRLNLTHLSHYPLNSKDTFPTSNNGDCNEASPFIHSDHSYSASSSPLLLRNPSNTARILCRSFMPKRHRQL